jgi:hypothetical protein
VIFGWTWEVLNVDKGIEMKKERLKKRRLWFLDGFWWFRNVRNGSVREISSLMRYTRYDARELADALGVGERAFHRLVKEDVGLSGGYWLRCKRSTVGRRAILAWGA